jgi:anti-sigma B factor antagonist
MALGDLEISIAPAGSGATAVIEAVGEVDLGNSDRLAESATVAGAGGGGVILDMSGVTFMDSSGLKALLLATRELGSGLAVVVTPGSSVERLIVLAGVADRIPNYASRSEALNALDSAGSQHS